MKEQAASLLQLVSRFKLGSGAQAQAAPVQPKAPRKAAPPRNAAPEPIRVRNADPLRLTSGFGALGPSAKAALNGEWKEF
jgi:hypothetical protein